MIKQLAAFVFTAALVLSSGAAHAENDEVDQDSALRSYYSANGLLNRGLYELAAAEYRSFLDAHGDHEKAPEARYGLGVCLYRTGQYEQTITELELLGDHPDTPYLVEVLTILGQCHLSQKDYEAASDCLAVVVQQHADHGLADDAAVLLAEALYHRGEYEQTERTCGLFSNRWPDSPLRERADLLAGLALMARGKYPEAAEGLRDMLQRFPEGAYSDHANLLLAQCLHHSNALREAVAQYQDVIGRANRQFLPDALYGVAGALHQLNQHEAAGELVDQLRELFPEDELIPPASLLRGRIWLALEDYPKARTELDRLVENEEGVREAALYWRAKCDLKAANPEAAAELLEQALREFPKGELAAEIIFDWAVALSRSEKTEEAIEQWEQFR
ncbi:MAG: tetratricopeptide repeat protein, partial [Phycisphaerales bacterium]